MTVLSSANRSRVDALPAPPSDVEMMRAADRERTQLRPEKGLAILNKAALLYPKSAEVFNVRADLNKDCGNMAQALADQNHALELMPNNLEFVKKRAKINDMTGKLKEAIKDYDYVLSRSPRDQRTWQERAIAYKRLKQYGQAAKDFDQAVKCDSDQHSLHDLLYDRAQMYLLAGDLPHAQSSCDQLVQKYPDLSRGYWLRAQVFDKLDQITLAARDRSKAKDLDSNMMPLGF